MAKYRVENVVVRVNLKTNIPLEKLARELPNVEYDTEQFPGAIYRHPNGKALLVFTSGIVNVTGSSSIEEAKKMIEDLRRDLGKIGVKTPKNYDLKVVNIVIRGEFDLDGEIDILKLVNDLENVEYDPETFPGAIVREKGATFLIFKGGKFVCCGAKSVKDAEQIIKKCEELIKKYTKPKK